MRPDGEDGGLELDLYEGAAESAAGPPVAALPETQPEGAAGANGWIESLWRDFPRPVRERYSPGKAIGEGGMGIVLEAHDRELGRIVAIKGLRDPVAASAAGRDRQAREARIAARLTHPNILPVFDIWTDARGNPWCSMLRVPGEAQTLARRLEELKDRRALEDRPVGELLETFRQVCRAVAYAHGQGVLHRDLKPDNVLLGPSGEALVADWGLARAESVPDEPSASLELVGTRGYAAPEQLGAFGAPRADERSDVYSLGVILFEMLAGHRRDSPGGVEANTWAAGLGGGSPQPQALDIPARVPRELADVIRRATAWQPGDRLSSVAALLRAVELYLEGGVIEGMSYTAWERTRKWARAHPALFWTLVTAFVFSVVLFKKYDDNRRALELAHGYLALSHTGWAAQASKSSLSDVARMHAALALQELSQAAAGFVLPSGEAYSLLAGAGPPSPLLWAVTLDGPAEVAKFGDGGRSLSAATRLVGSWQFALPSGRVVRHTPIPKEEVWGLAISPDRKLLATVGADKLVRVWDASSGQELRRMAGHTEALWSLDFAPSGKLLATGGHDHTVRLWDVASGQAVATFEGHTGQVWSVAFSPDGALLASGDTDRVIRIWDVVARRQVRVLAGHQGAVLSLAFSPDSDTLASGADDRVIRLWAIGPSGKSGSLEGAAGTGQCLAFSPDGRTLASGHSDYSVRLWDLATRKPSRVLLGHTNWLSMLDFSSDGRTLASASQDRTIRLWDVGSASLPEGFAGHTAPVLRMALSADGRRIATASQDHTVREWECETGKMLRSLSGFERLVQTVAYSGGENPAMAGSLGEAVEWRLPGRPPMRLEMEKGRGVQCLEFAPDCGRLAISTTGGVVRVVDTRSAADTARLTGSGGETLCLAFSADGRRLATGGTYRDVLLWDAAGGRLLARGAGHRESVECVRFSPDGRWLASGGQDFAARLWEVPAMTGKLVGSHTGHLWAVAFSPDGRTLASGGLDGKIRLWGLPGFAPLGLFEPNASSVTALAFDPAGRRLVSAGGTQPQVWDLRVITSPGDVAREVLASSYFEVPAGQLLPAPKPAAAAPPPRFRQATGSK